MLFIVSSRRRHTRCALLTGVQTCALPIYGGPLTGMAFPDQTHCRTAPARRHGSRVACRLFLYPLATCRHTTCLSKVGTLVAAACADCNDYTCTLRRNWSPRPR